RAPTASTRSQPSSTAGSSPYGPKNRGSAVGNGRSARSMISVQTSGATSRSASARSCSTQPRAPLPTSTTGQPAAASSAAAAAQAASSGTAGPPAQSAHSALLATGGSGASAGTGPRRKSSGTAR